MVETKAKCGRYGEAGRGKKLLFRNQVNLVPNCYHRIKRFFRSSEPFQGGQDLGVLVEGIRMGEIPDVKQKVGLQGVF